MIYSAEFEVFTQASAWLREGRKVVLFTVIETWGSAPRSPGALLAVSRDGLPVGSVSGGCVEEDLIKRVKAGEFDKHYTISYGLSREEGERFGLPCGGVLNLAAEPLRDAEQLNPVLRALSERRLIRRELDLETGHGTWHPDGTEEALRYDGRVLSCTFGPAWRLLIIGAGQTSRYLAEFALALDYQVIVCDPRTDYARMWKVDGTEIDHRMPDDAVTALARDPRCAVAALTHDPKLDDMALMEALLSPAFYVGALGSRRNSEARRRRLAELDIPVDALDRLRAPVGLPIGSHTPPEIALAVLAEITAVRRGICLVKQG